MKRRSLRAISLQTGRQLGQAPFAGYRPRPVSAPGEFMCQCQIRGGCEISCDKRKDQLVDWQDRRTMPAEDDLAETFQFFDDFISIYP